MQQQGFCRRRCCDDNKWSIIRTLNCTTRPGLLLQFVITIMLNDACGLRNVTVSVPQYKVRTEPALLQCDYDLENDNLYSVKWYKDNEELYRYMPRNDPPQHSYNIDGLKVDRHVSDNKKLLLKSVTLRASGLYRCEVSAEAPSFDSGQAEARMEVVYLPKDGPHISGQQLEYQVGEQLELNCTSGRSYPASILHWYINEQQVTSPSALIHYPAVKHSHGLVSSALGLQFQVAARHFLDGAIHVRCVASVSPVLWQGDRESVVVRTAQIVNREAYLYVKAEASLLEAPTIILLTSLLAKRLS